MGFSLARIREATGGEILSGTEVCSPRISIDSRSVQPGDLFIAIRGERFDGHDYIHQAVQAGAASVITSRRVDVPAGIGLVVVADTLSALGDLARTHRRGFHLPVVAVTGSTGKTSTKEMIACIGAVRHRVVKTMGNQNNEIGLPITLLNLSAGDELLVLEMGMRGLGQIADLARLARPDIGVVTNIGEAHLELLGSQAKIAEAKSELLSALAPEGTAVIPGDDPFFAFLSQATRARVLPFGLSEIAAVKAAKLNLGPENSCFQVNAEGWPEYEIRLSVPGRYHVLNALAAIAVAYALGYQPYEISEGLAGFSPAKGRGAARQSAAGWTIIDDTYNANPASMEAALEVLNAGNSSGRRIAVLADMLELGPSGLQAHRRVGRFVAGTDIAMLLTFGQAAREICRGAVQSGFPATRARSYLEKNRLIEDLKAVLREGDTVLIKGSRGMHMEEVVSSLLQDH